MGANKVEQAAKEQEKLEELDKESSLPHLLAKLNKNLLPDDILENNIGNDYIFFAITFDTKPDIAYCIHLSSEFFKGILIKIR